MAARESGCQSSEGESDARRLSTQEQGGVELILSISLGVLLSESQLSPGEKRADGRGVEAESAGEFVVREALAAKDEKLGLA